MVATLRVVPSLSNGSDAEQAKPKYLEEEAKSYINLAIPPIKDFKKIN